MPVRSDRVQSILLAFTPLQNAIERGLFQALGNRQDSQPDMKLVSEVALDIARAMAALHSQGILHGGAPWTLLRTLPQIFPKPFLGTLDIPRALAAHQSLGVLRGGAPWTPP